MLKIEVIKFEAQDVITASVAAPAPVNPTVDPCACEHLGPCVVRDDGRHWLFVGTEDEGYCDHEIHTCGK